MNTHLPRIYVDFNDMLGPNSFALICVGTQDELRRQNLILRKGMRLEVYDSELSATGVVGTTKPNEGWPGAGHWIIDVDPKSWKEIANDEM